MIIIKEFLKQKRPTTYPNPNNYRLIILMLLLAQTYDNKLDIMKDDIFINLE